MALLYVLEDNAMSKQTDSGFSPVFYGCRGLNLAIYSAGTYFSLIIDRSDNNSMLVHFEEDPFPRPFRRPTVNYAN